MNTKEFKNHLISEEKSEATAERYMRDVTAYITWLNGREMSKELMIQYKAELVDKYEPASVNTMLSSLNAYLDFKGYPEFKARNLKVQKSVYIEPKREITKAEYERLLRTAYEMKKYRIYYIMQTICSCGIRVSELKYITVEAIKRGIAHISNKGKSRRVFIPNKLSKLLEPYIMMNKIKSGMIFKTRTGKPTRMTPETRAKLREAHLNTGEGKTYTKLYGMHEHRVVAENQLGRPLKKGEVVHHVDGDCRNNNPDNLLVLPSQKEHAALHARLNKFFA